MATVPDFRYALGFIYDVVLIQAGITRFLLEPVYMPAQYPLNTWNHNGRNPRTKRRL